MLVVMNLVNGLVLIVIFKMVNGFGNVIDQTINEPFTTIQTVIELVGLVVIHHKRWLYFIDGNGVIRLVDLLVSSGMHAFVW